MNKSSPNKNIEIDAITLEVLRNALQSIAEEMGAVLKNTSFSPNIKERMDASCAIFDAQGELVAQAEHVPVHLGSMLVALRQVLERVPSIEEGDIILVNDPYVGGGHIYRISHSLEESLTIMSSSVLLLPEPTILMSVVWSQDPCLDVRLRCTRKVL